MSPLFCKKKKKKAGVANPQNMNFRDKQKTHFQETFPLLPVNCSSCQNDVFIISANQTVSLT